MIVVMSPTSRVQRDSCRVCAQEPGLLLPAGHGLTDQLTAARGRLRLHGAQPAALRVCAQFYAETRTARRYQHESSLEVSGMADADLLQAMSAEVLEICARVISGHKADHVVVLGHPACFAHCWSCHRCRYVNVASERDMWAHGMWCVNVPCTLCMGLAVCVSAMSLISKLAGRRHCCHLLHRRDFAADWLHTQLSKEVRTRVRPHSD